MNRQKLADGSLLFQRRRVDGEHRRGLGHAVALEQAASRISPCTCGGSPPSAARRGDDVAQRAEAVGVCVAGVSREEGVGADEDRRADYVDELRSVGVAKRSSGRGRPSSRS